MSTITTTVPATTTDRVTPDEFLDMPNGVGYELVDGRLTERHVGAESSAIAIAIAAVLRAFTFPQRLGHIFGSDTSYQCFANDPGRIRRADVAFVRGERLPNGRPPKGQVRIAPDLVVEVVSPNDTADDVEDKIAEWLGAGVRLLWVAYPTTRTVRVFRPAGSGSSGPSAFSGSEMITGEDVLPGFTCPVSQFFEDVA